MIIIGKLRFEKVSEEDEWRVYSEGEYLGHTYRLWDAMVFETVRGIGVTSKQMLDIGKFMSAPACDVEQPGYQRRMEAIENGIIKAKRRIRSLKGVHLSP